MNFLYFMNFIYMNFYIFSYILSSIWRNFFFDYMSKKFFFNSKKLFSVCNWIFIQFGSFKMHFMKFHLRGLGSQKLDFFYYIFQWYYYSNGKCQSFKSFGCKMKKWETKRLSAFRKNWQDVGNFKLVFLEILYLFRFAVIAKNVGSDRFENCFAFAEHVPLWAETPY